MDKTKEDGYGSTRSGPSAHHDVASSEMAFGVATRAWGEDIGLAMSYWGSILVLGGDATYANGE